LTLIEKIEGSNFEATKLQNQAWREGSQAIKNFEETTGQKFKNGLQVLVKVLVNFHVFHGLALSILDIDQEKA
jgi:exodeoxyribonuclease VII large subunit